MTSRIRDQFIASVHVLKNRPWLYKELIEAAAKWKKTGELTADEYDMIVAATRLPAWLRDVK